MADIVQVKALVEVLAKLGNAVGAIAEDGKVSVADVPAVLGLLPSLGSLAAIDFAKVEEEIKDLDAAEAQALADHFSAHFDLPQQSLEEKIEAGLAYVKHAVLAVQAVIAVVKALKK